MWLEDEVDPRSVDPGDADSVCGGLRALLRQAGVERSRREACCQIMADLEDEGRRALWERLRGGSSEAARLWANLAVPDV